MRKFIYRDHGEQKEIKHFHFNTTISNKKEHENHLKHKYQIYYWFYCELCDFKTQEHNELTQYLEKTHQIGFFDKIIIKKKEMLNSMRKN